MKKLVSHIRDAEYYSNHD